MVRQKNLSKRLQKLAEYIGTQDVVIDVGTDHAYLPIYLLKRGKCKSVIASDMRDGPVESAKRNVEKYGLKDKIDIRKGYGLDVLTKNEADVAVIAGMGGGTVQQILDSADKKVLTGLKRLILQPMNDEKILRQWLIINGWCLIDEDLILEGDQIYTVIVVDQGEERLYDELTLEIGPRLIEKNHPLLALLISNLKEKYLAIAKGLKLSKNTKDTVELIRIKQKLEKIEEMFDKKCRCKTAK